MDYLGANCDMIWMNIYYKMYLQKIFSSTFFVKKTAKWHPALFWNSLLVHSVEILSTKKMLDGESYLSHMITMAISFFFFTFEENHMEKGIAVEGTLDINVLACMIVLDGKVVLSGIFSIVIETESDQKQKQKQTVSGAWFHWWLCYSYSYLVVLNIDTNYRVKS